MRIRVYATLRDMLHTSAVELDVQETTPMHSILERLATMHPVLRSKFWDADGKPIGFVQILLNGRPIQYLQGYDTCVEPSDTLSLFPPVGGG